GDPNPAPTSSLNGDGWRPISTPDLNGWTSHAEIDALAVAATRAGIIYATAGGQIFITSDSGSNWQLSLGADHFAGLLVDPTNEQVAYAVRDRFNQGQTGDHVWQTAEGGGWQDISGNLPDVPVNTIALDPRVPATLYVGTGQGVY